MSVNYKEISRRIGQETPKYRIGAELVSDFVTSLEERGLLPKKLPDPTLPSGEALVEVKRFSPEAREILGREGYVIYLLTRQSIESLQGAGRESWLRWHKNYPRLVARASRQSEVAVNPRQLFLPESNGKTLAEQETMVKKFSEKPDRKIEGVKTIIGEASDYVKLDCLHLGATGEQLFGGRKPGYGFPYIRSKTLLSGTGSVCVTDPFGEGYRADIWVRHVDAWAAPLVVPA